MNKTRYDNSLSRFIDVVRASYPDEPRPTSVFIRDTTGRLSAVLDRDLSKEEIESLDAALEQALGGYVRPDGIIRDRTAPGAARLLHEGTAVNRTTFGTFELALLDRRLVGADWLMAPAPAATIPTIAFGSLKGGVGRSTALAVAASYLSSKGLRTLAVDLDLEAPGIGTMLIEPAALPDFGTLDYLVENGVSGIDDDFMSNFVGESFLGSAGGRVSVLPAIGKVTLDNPSGALAKIARAYVEDVTPEGVSVSLTAQIREMVGRFSKSNDFDVILVDGRAGLHETTAAVLLGLGADVLLFGVDEPQTYLGYKLLLSHLNSYRAPEYSSWQDRVQFVHAKSSSDTSLQDEASANFHGLYALAYDVELEHAPDRLTEDDFDMVWDDSDDDDNVEIRELKVLRIFDDERYKGFDPIKDRGSLEANIYGATYDSLIRWLDETIPALAMDEEDA